MLTMLSTSFKERERRPSFWLLLGAVAIFAIMCTPRFDTGVKVMALDPKIYRQADNPTWLPICAAEIFGFFLPMIGFGVVENALQTDRLSGVWPWVTTLHFARLRYGLAKFFSNCLILLIMWALTVAATALMILIRFPGQGVRLATFFSPFLALLPSVILIAAIALLVESLTAKRHNMITAIAVITLFYELADEMTYPHAFWHRLLSLSGSVPLQAALDQGSRAATGRRLSSIQFLSSYTGPQGTHTLHIPPVPFTSTTLTFMIGEVLVAFALAVIASLLLHRAWEEKQPRHQPAAAATTDSPALAYAPVNASGGQWAHLLLLEGQRQWHAQSLTYRLMLVGTWLMMWLIPSAGQAQFGLPLLWLLTIPWLGSLGSAPSSWQTWLNTIPNAWERQKGAELLVSGTAAVVLMLPFIVRQPSAALQYLLVALATAALAQGLGSLFNNGRLFTMIMTFFWFIYLNGITAMVSPAQFSGAVCVTFVLVLAAGLGSTQIVHHRQTA